MIELTADPAAEGTNARTSADPPPSAQFDEDPKPDTGQHKLSPLWHGWEGLSMMVFGFIFPALLLTIGSIACSERLVRLVLRHPVETILEYLFVALIPAGNYLAWKAIRTNDKRYAVRLGVMNGIAVGTSAVVGTVTAASLFFGYPPHYGLLSISALLACTCSVYLSWRLRGVAETRLSQNRRVLYSACGLLLSLVGFAASEARPTAIRMAEYLALSSTPRDHRVGMEWLRKLGSEKDLRMECADERTAGLPGMFIKISPEKERQLYFAVTGKPYGNSLTDSVYSMSDDYLQKHVVGDVMPELSLVRSALTGNLNPKTMTSTVDWTYVFKNDSFFEQEARAEIAVPPGASVSGLTMWSHGEACNASFGPTDPQRRSNRYVDVTNMDPALVSDLGRGRVLLKCSSIPAQGEIKVCVRITSRMKPETPTSAILTLPKFIATNFHMEGGHHQLRLHGNGSMQMNLQKDRNMLTKDAGDGTRLLTASLNESDLHGTPMQVNVARPDSVGPFVAEDKLSPSGGYVIERLEKVTALAPDNLIIVVDASESMKANLSKVKQALQQVPNKEKASIVIAADGVNPDPVPFAEGLSKLDENLCKGGENNLEAVIKASEAAGDTARGAVLWIHGPQPSFNEEIYPMAPYIRKPRFYELALDDGFTDSSEFFRNHREIGPFSPVPRSGTIDRDLSFFLGKWQPGGFEYGISFKRSAEKPAGEVIQGASADEVARLCARDQCYDLMREARLSEASDIAASCHVVTPVSAAVVLSRAVQAIANNDVTQDPVRAAALQGAQNGTIGPNAGDQLEAPALQGATSGTIGPQGIISGVNTAGTVRVNNLANLEALLNIIANLCELSGVLIGIVLVVMGAVFKKGIEHLNLTPAGTVATGFALGIGGLAVPGVINWLVASARDANLFS